MNNIDEQKENARSCLLYVNLSDSCLLIELYVMNERKQSEIEINLRSKAVWT